MRDDVVQRREELAAQLSAWALILIHPHARHLLLTLATSTAGVVAAAAPHVPEKCPVWMMRCRVRYRWMLLMVYGRWRGQVRRPEVLMMRWDSAVLGVVRRIVRGGSQCWMLTPVMGELLHASSGGTSAVWGVMQGREQAQTGLGGGWIGRRVELVLASQQKVAGRVGRMMMAHVMAHVRRHVRGRVRMMVTGVALVEVVLLNWSLAGGRLNRATTAIGHVVARRQLYAEIGQVVRMI